MLISHLSNFLAHPLDDKTRHWSDNAPLPVDRALCPKRQGDERSQPMMCRHRRHANF